MRTPYFFLHSAYDHHLLKGQLLRNMTVYGGAPPFSSDEDEAAAEGMQFPKAARQNICDAAFVVEARPVFARRT